MKGILFMSLNANDTHKKIVKAAHKLFMDLGYRAVSTRRIAEACGITQPTLYHHFSNKKAIYMEVLRTELVDMQNALGRIIKRFEDDIEECLFQVTYYILINKPPSMGQMFHDIQKELDQEHQGTVRKWWMESYQDPIASIFEKGIKDQKLRDPGEIGSDPVSSAYLLLSLISSRNTDYKLKESLAKEQARFYIKVILYGLSQSNGQ